MVLSSWSSHYWGLFRLTELVINWCLWGTPNCPPSTAELYPLITEELLNFSAVKFCIFPLKLASCSLFSWNKIYLPLVCKAATRHNTTQQLCSELSAALVSHGAGLNRHCLVTGLMPLEKPVKQGSQTQTTKHSRKFISLAPMCILQLCDTDLASCWWKHQKLLLNVCISTCSESYTSSQGWVLATKSYANTRHPLACLTLIDAPSYF